MVSATARQWFVGAALGVALGVGAYAAGSALSGKQSTPAARSGPGCCIQSA